MIFRALLIVATASGCIAESNDEPFRFIVNADPQMGEADARNPGIRKLNALLEGFVAEVNAQDPAPSFVVFDGDLVAFPRPASFANFVRLVEPLTVPVKLVHGNHDGKFPDTQFLDAQEKLQGQRALQYSWNQGRWHFTVIPAPEMTPKAEQRQALLDWLRADLAEHSDRPTMVFMHYHLLPVGLSQLEYYTLEMNYKRELLEVLTGAQNLRYVISGHVHAGVKASIKSAWTYRGVNFVVAPSPVWPRAFGDEFPQMLQAGDGENMGYYLEVEIEGDEATLYGRKIGASERHRYPPSFAEFREDLDPRALSTIPEVDAAPELVNGDFEEGMQGWLGPWRYRHAKPAGFIRTTRSNKGTQGRAAYLRVRQKDRPWTYDESEEIFQVVRWSPQERPLVSLDYRVTAEGYTAFGGGYVRIVGYRGGTRVLTELFHWGAREHQARHLPLIFNYIAMGDEFSIEHFHQAARRGDVLAWRIPEVPTWQTLRVNVADLFERGGPKPRQWSALGVDRLAIAVGVWAGQRPESGGAVWLDNVTLRQAADEPTVLGRRQAVISPRARQAPYGSHFLDGVGL